MRVVPPRLQPGDDLRRALEAWMGERQEQAGCVLSAVGSLSLAHPHIAVADNHGAVIGLLPEWRFSREFDPATGYAELAIKTHPER